MSAYPRYSDITLGVRRSDGMFYLKEALYVWFSERQSLEIEEGFATDLASLPFFLRWIVRTWGKWTVPSVVHDAEYDLRIGTRKEADLHFLEGMAVWKTWWVTRYAFYLGVRAGGWWRWYRVSDRIRFWR